MLSKTCDFSAANHQKIKIQSFSTFQTQTCICFTWYCPKIKNKKSFIFPHFLMKQTKLRTLGITIQTTKTQKQDHSQRKTQQTTNQNENRKNIKNLKQKEFNKHNYLSKWNQIGAEKEEKGFHF